MAQLVRASLSAKIRSTRLGKKACEFVYTNKKICVTIGLINFTFEINLSFNFVTDITKRAITYDWYILQACKPYWIQNTCKIGINFVLIFSTIITVKNLLVNYSYRQTSLIRISNKWGFIGLYEVLLGIFRNMEVQSTVQRLFEHRPKCTSNNQACSSCVDYFENCRGQSCFT